MVKGVVSCPGNGSRKFCIYYLLRRVENKFMFSFETWNTGTNIVHLLYLYVVIFTLLATTQKIRLQFLSWKSFLYPAVVMFAAVTVAIVALYGSYKFLSFSYGYSIEIS